jgi:hypothetical protein
MAMNKKEQEQMTALQKALRLAKALRWTEPVAPDLLPPHAFNKETSGFAFNTHSGTVSPAWSDSVSHSIGHASREAMGRSSASQRSSPLYSTRLRALRAMRAVVEKEVAERLAAIDAKIEMELGVAGAGDDNE